MGGLGSGCADRMGGGPSPRPSLGGRGGMIMFCACRDFDERSHSALTRPAADLSRGERGTAFCADLIPGRPSPGLRPTSPGGRGDDHFVCFP